MVHGRPAAGQSPLFGDCPAADGKADVDDDDDDDDKDGDDGSQRKKTPKAKATANIKVCKKKEPVAKRT